MILKKITLNNYRNYRQAEVCFHPRINIIYGMNAQGKTNLLEAISYLGLASSFRDSGDSELVNWQDACFFIEGEIETATGTDIITASWSKEKKKCWKINGNSRHRYNDIMGHFHTVVFSPDDLYLIKGSPEARRKFLNGEMSQIYPDYYSLFIRYSKILRQRNALLKEEIVPEDQLAVWTEQLVKIGAELIINRARFMEILAPEVCGIYAQLAGGSPDEGGDNIGVEYRSVVPTELLTDTNRIKEIFEEKLHGLRAAERARGMTLAGPHRDDISISFGGREARSAASQGQQRTAALALKLAEIIISERIHGEPPVLLLDDVMSELDENRRYQVLTLLCQRAQTFITGTDLTELSKENTSESTAGKCFFVENGIITELV